MMYDVKRRKAQGTRLEASGVRCQVSGIKKLAYSPFIRRGGGKGWGWE